MGLFSLYFLTRELFLRVKFLGKDKWNGLSDHGLVRTWDAFMENEDELSYSSLHISAGRSLPTSTERIHFNKLLSLCQRKTHCFN